MSTHDWLRAPIGIDSARWVSRPGRRTVLAVVHTVVSSWRILDVVDHVETDPRVQVVYTVAPGVFNRSVADRLRTLGALVVPWSQAVHERFDLAVAAGWRGLTDLHAPLIFMSHGAGHGKLVRPRPGHQRRPETTPVYGLDSRRLTDDDALLPSVVLLAHHGERDILRRQFPQALPIAEVVGDPSFDRLLASLPCRDEYRRALRVSAGQEVVLISSTWGSDGLFGGDPDLLPRLVRQLPPDRFRVVALLHPAVWEAHGRRQIRAWTADVTDAGLVLPEPTDDWRAYVAAADRVIGDHGSVTAYAAGLGLPVLHLPVRPEITAPGSAQHMIASRDGALDRNAPLLPQLRAARPVDREAVLAGLTSRPGQAGPAIRRLMYRMLKLSQPGRHRRAAPVPVPAPVPPRNPGTGRASTPRRVPRGPAHPNGGQRYATPASPGRACRTRRRNVRRNSPGARP